MSIQLDAFSMTPNPVDAKGKLTIFAKVTEIPEEVSPVIDDTLGAWFDCTAMPIQDDTGLYVSKQAPTTFLAQVQYDKTKQEYQLAVQALHTVHLDSGQPLGARLYYLPRGTQLHFISAQEELVLG